MAHVSEGKSIGPYQKKNAKMKALNLETKNQARDQVIIQLKD
jgi:hypothetical protein